MKDNHNHFVYLPLRRPVAPGTCPRGFVRFENFDERTTILGFPCLAWAAYDRQLTPDEVAEYEMAELCARSENRN